MKEFSLVLTRIRDKLRVQQQAVRCNQRHEMHKRRRPNLILEEREWIPINIADLKQLTHLLNNLEAGASFLKIIKRSLSKDEKHIQTFINVHDALEKLVQFMIGANIEIKLESIGCCTNLCFGSHETTVKVIAAAGPYLITFLHGSNSVLQDYACKCLGNMAYDCHVCCRLLRYQGLIFAMVKLLQSSYPYVIRSCLFVLQNFTRHHTEKETECLMKEGILSSLSKLESSRHIDPNILSNIYHVYFHLTVQIELCEDYFYKEAIHQNAMNHLHVFCFKLPINVTVITAIIRCLGNLTSMNNIFSLEILHYSHFETCLLKLFHFPFHHVIKETFWIFNNIIASCDSQLMWDSIDMVSIVNAFLMLLHNKTMEQEALHTLCILAAKKPNYTTILQNEAILKLQQFQFQ